MAIEFNPLVVIGAAAILCAFIAFGVARRTRIVNRGSVPGRDRPQIIAQEIPELVEVHLKPLSLYEKDDASMIKGDEENVDWGNISPLSAKVLPSASDDSSPASVNAAAPNSRRHENPSRLARTGKQADSAANTRDMQIAVVVVMPSQYSSNPPPNPESELPSSEFALGMTTVPVPGSVLS